MVSVPLHYRGQRHEVAVARVARLPYAILLEQDAPGFAGAVRAHPATGTPGGPGGAPQAGAQPHWAGPDDPVATGASLDDSSYEEEADLEPGPSANPPDAIPHPPWQEGPDFRGEQDRDDSLAGLRRFAAVDEGEVLDERRSRRLPRVVREARRWFREVAGQVGP